MFVKGLKQDRCPSLWSLMDCDTAEAWGGRQSALKAGGFGGRPEESSVCVLGRGLGAHQHFPECLLFSSRQAERPSFLEERGRLWPHAASVTPHDPERSSGLFSVCLTAVRRPPLGPLPDVL
ncbi:unnamed protein product [Rangifer tarandus platyrhynchus]|uniref:Uncharacterized protein n=1 Tax=Rangifer tarandus platyrhynchus TaxID=3082113 RepID=A0AC59Z593_RANTA